MFLSVLFLRSWNVHWSFPGTWLPSSFLQLHEYRKQLCQCCCSGSCIGASSCLWTFPFFILVAACAALQCNSGGSVTCSVDTIHLFHALHRLCQCSLCLSLLASPQILSPFIGHQWRELFSNTAVPVLKIPWVKCYIHFWLLVNLLISSLQFFSNCCWISINYSLVIFFGILINTY